jgi:hypothetical protein
VSVKLLVVGACLFSFGAFNNLLSRRPPPDDAWVVYDRVYRKTAPWAWRIGVLLMVAGLLVRVFGG